MVSWIRSLALQTHPLWDPLYIACYKVARGYRGPIPSLVNRRRVGSAAIGRFLEAGRNIYRPMREVLGEHFGEELGRLRVLDFGAGVGRMLSLLQADCPQAEATDVDASAVAYLRRAFPQLRVHVNQYDPPLSFANGQFDAVCSVSIWTHLPPANQMTWLREIHRVVRPGGVALITTSGYTALRVRRQRDAEWADVLDADLTRQGFIYKEYPQFQAGDSLNFPGITHSYGLAAHSPAFIREEWGRIFCISDIREGVIDHVQDLVVLKKPGS